jgi:hypothetical protein
MRDKRQWQIFCLIVVSIITAWLLEKLLPKAANWQDYAWITVALVVYWLVWLTMLKADATIDPAGILEGRSKTAPHPEYRELYMEEFRKRKRQMWLWWFAHGILAAIFLFLYRYIPK